MGVVEIGYIRIIECNMTVFSNSQTDNIDRMTKQQFGITFAFFFKVFCLSVQIVYSLERDFVEDALTEKISETLWGFRMNADVFIHVESVDSAPVNLFTVNKMT